MATEQTSANPRIELSVISRPALKGGTTPGHIMVAVAIAGVGEQAWGFYRDGIQDEIAKGGWIRYTSSTVIQITGGQYRTLVQAIETYRKQHKYGLLTTNCRHFVSTVLQQSGIEVPEKHLWPNDEGKAFMKMYGEGWGSCLAD
jgi:hypothetical protein